jgi:enoyl-CoA hydratase/carnithine racemase
VITGTGEKAFAAGADVAQLSSLDTIDAFEQMVLGQRVFLRIHEFPKPSIAMVNGYALGGGFELALACDMIVASERATFGFPEINLNTMPGWGGTQLAPKKMSLNRAKEMVLTGRHYPARTCWDFGFINRLVRPEELYSATMELAGAVAAKPPFSLRMAKDTLNRGIHLDLATGMHLEAQAYAVNFSGPHAKAGFDAFLDRRKRAEQAQRTSASARGPEKP